jgi:hypothetical protein
MLPAPHYLAQPSPYAIPHDRSADPSRGDKPHPKSFVSVHSQHTQREEGSADCFPFASHLLELPSKLQPSFRREF